MTSAAFRYFCGLSHQGSSSIRTRAFSRSRSSPDGKIDLDPPSSKIAFLTSFSLPGNPCPLIRPSWPESYRLLLQKRHRPGTLTWGHSGVKFTLRSLCHYVSAASFNDSLVPRVLQKEGTDRWITELTATLPHDPPF